MVTMSLGMRCYFSSVKPEVLPGALIVDIVSSNAVEQIARHRGRRVNDDTVRGHGDTQTGAITRLHRRVVRHTTLQSHVTHVDA